MLIVPGRNKKLNWLWVRGLGFVVFIFLFLLLTFNFSFFTISADHCSEDPDDSSCHQGDPPPESPPEPPPEPSCTDDADYCDGEDRVIKGGGYFDGSECVYNFDVRRGECASGGGGGDGAGGSGDSGGSGDQGGGDASCQAEEGSYCEDGTLWFKDGSFLNDAGECVFNFHPASSQQSAEICGGGVGQSVCDPQGGVDPGSWNFDGVDCQSSNPDRRGQAWSCSETVTFTHGDLCDESGNYVDPGFCGIEPAGYSACFPGGSGNKVCEVYDDSCAEGFDPVTANCRNPQPGECGSSGDSGKSGGAVDEFRYIPTPEEVAACGGIDPNDPKWEFNRLECDPYNKGTIGEMWTCGQIIKFSNDRPDQACEKPEGLKLPGEPGLSATSQETDETCQAKNQDKYYCDGSRCIYKSSGFDGYECVAVFRETSPGFCPNSCVDNTEKSGELPQDKDAACKTSFGDPVYYCDGAVCIGRTQKWNGLSCVEDWPRVDPSKCPNSCKGEQTKSGLVAEDEQCRAETGNNFYCDGSVCFNHTKGWGGKACTDVYEKVDPRNCPNSCIGNTVFSGSTIEAKDFACKKDVKEAYYCDGEVCVSPTKVYNPENGECADAWPKVPADKCPNSCKGNTDSSGLIVQDNVCKYKFGQSQYYCDTGTCIAKNSGFDGKACVDVFSRAESQASCPFSCVGNKDASGREITTQPQTTPPPVSQGKPSSSQEEASVSECKYVQECEGGGSYQACHGTKDENGACIYKEGTECSLCQATPPDLHPDNVANTCAAGVCVDGPGPVCITDDECSATKPGASCNFPQVCPEGGTQACRGEINEGGGCEYVGSSLGSSCTECQDSPIVYSKNAFCYLGACVGGPGAACLTNLDCVHTLPPPPPPQVIATTPVYGPTGGNCYARVNCEVSGNEPDEYLTGYATKYWVGVDSDGSSVDCTGMAGGRVFAAGACPPDEPPSARASDWIGERANAPNALSAWAISVDRTSPNCTPGTVYCDKDGYINDVNGCIERTQVASCINQAVRTAEQNQVSFVYGNDVTVASYNACRASAEADGVSFSENLTCDGQNIVDKLGCLPTSSSGKCTEIAAAQTRVDLEDAASVDCKAVPSCSKNSEYLIENSCVPGMVSNHGFSQQCADFIASCDKAKICDFQTGNMVSINRCSGEKTETDTVCPQDLIKANQEELEALKGQDRETRKPEAGGGGIPVISGIGNALGWVKDRSGDVASAVSEFYGGIFQGFTTNPFELNSKIVQGNDELILALRQEKIHTPECQAYIDQYDPYGPDAFGSLRRGNNPCLRDATIAGTQAYDKALSTGSANDGLLSLGINPYPDTKTVTTGFCLNLGVIKTNICNLQDTLLPADQTSDISQVWRLAEAKKYAEILGLALYDENGNPVDPNTWDQAKAKLFFDAVARNELNPGKAILEGAVGLAATAFEKFSSSLRICNDKWGSAACRYDSIDQSITLNAFANAKDADFERLNSAASQLYDNFTPSDPELVRRYNDIKLRGGYVGFTPLSAQAMGISDEEYNQLVRTNEAYINASKFVQGYTPEGQLLNSQKEAFAVEQTIGIVTNAFDPVPGLKFVAGAVKGSIIAKVLAAPAKEIVQAGGRVAVHAAESIGGRFASKAAGETVEQLADRSIARVVAGEVPSNKEKAFLGAFLREHSSQNSGKIADDVLERIAADGTPSNPISRAELTKPVSEGGYGLTHAQVDHLRDFTDAPVLAGERRSVEQQADDLARNINNARDITDRLGPVTRNELVRDHNLTHPQVDFIRDFADDVPVLGEKNPTGQLADTVNSLKSTQQGRAGAKAALGEVADASGAQRAISGGSPAVVISSGAPQAPQPAKPNLIQRIANWFNDNTEVAPPRIADSVGQRLDQAVISTSQPLSGKTGFNKPIEELSSREISGIDSVGAKESIGGNAGELRYGANFGYKNDTGEFIFSNYLGTASDTTGVERAGIFGVKLPNIEQAIDLHKRTGVDIPQLIDSVFFREGFTDKALQDEIIERARQHNLKKLLDYLKIGGDPSLLPELPVGGLFKRDIDQVLGSLSSGDKLQLSQLGEKHAQAYRTYDEAVREWSKLQDQKDALAAKYQQQGTLPILYNLNSEFRRVNNNLSLAKKELNKAEGLLDAADQEAGNFNLQSIGKPCPISQTISPLANLGSNVLGVTSGPCPGKQIAEGVGGLARFIPGANLAREFLGSGDQVLGGRLSRGLEVLTNGFDKTPLAKPVSGFLDGVKGTFDNLLSPKVKNEVLPPPNTLDLSKRQYAYGGMDLNLPVLDQYPEYLQRTTAEITQAFRDFGLDATDSELEKRTIIDLLSRGHTTEEITGAVSRANGFLHEIQAKADVVPQIRDLDTITYELNFGFFRFSPDIQKAILALKYDSGFPPELIKNLLKAGEDDDLRLIWAKAFLNKERQKEVLEPVLGKTATALEKLRDFAVQNGADPESFSNLARVTGSDVFHIVNMKDFAVPGVEFIPGGLYMQSIDRQILIDSTQLWQAQVCTHECIHRIYDSGFAFGESERRIAEILGDWKDFRKLTEGLTEWTTIYGMKLSKEYYGKRQFVDFVAPTNYARSVRAVEEIRDAIARDFRAKGSKNAKERADAVVIEVALSGNIDKLFDAVHTNREASVARIKSILDKIPGGIYSGEVYIKRQRIAQTQQKIQETARNLLGATVVGSEIIGGIYLYNQIQNDPEVIENIKNNLQTLPQNLFPVPTP